MEFDFSILTSVKIHSNFPESFKSIFGCVECSGYNNSSSINSWHPLQTPKLKVSSRLKKSLIIFFAVGLYFIVPAHPFADPKTSEFENPPTATKNLISFKSSIPDVISVIWISLTSKPARCSINAISLSELLPFSLNTAALIFFLGILFKKFSKFSGNLNFNGVLSKKSNLSFALIFPLWLISNRYELLNQIFLSLSISKSMFFSPWLIFNLFELFNFPNFLIFIPLFKSFW